MTLDASTREPSGMRCRGSWSQPFSKDICAGTYAFPLPFDECRASASAVPFLAERGTKLRITHEGLVFLSLHLQIFAPVAVVMLCHRSPPCRHPASGRPSHPLDDVRCQREGRFRFIRADLPGFDFFCDVPPRRPRFSPCLK